MLSHLLNDNSAEQRPLRLLILPRRQWFFGLKRAVSMCDKDRLWPPPILLLKLFAKKNTAAPTMTLLEMIRGKQKTELWSEPTTIQLKSRKNINSRRAALFPELRLPIYRITAARAACDGMFALIYDLWTCFAINGLIKL